MPKPIIVALILSSLVGSAWAADDQPSVTPTATGPVVPAAPPEPTTDTPAAKPQVPGLPPSSPAPAPSPQAPPGPPPPAPPVPVAPGPGGGEVLKEDVLPNAGYVPGYRTYQGLSLGPTVPRTGALPGNVTPGFGAPTPPTQWTFKFTGFLNDTFQSSIGHRMVVGPDQTGVVFHIQPQVVDEYASFLGTNTMPGQWISLGFSYGNPIVSANVELNTWNPTEPTTYYQVGGQNFINNAFLQFDVPPLDAWRLRAKVGYFYTNYGGLGQYGLGVYTNAIIGLVRGVGEDVVAEYKLSPTLSLFLDEGFMGNRNGKVPDGTLPDAGNGNTNPVYPAAWIAHLHAGLVATGTTTLRLTGHVVTNWAQDDRVQCQNASLLSPVPGQCFDNPTTREINEAYIPDGRLTVAGFDSSASHPIWGYLGLGASYTKATNAAPLRGLATYGGEGMTLTDRWFGTTTGGTGSLYVAGVNYTTSLGRILSAPSPVRGDAPDLIINAGAIVAYSVSGAIAPSGATDTSNPSATTPGTMALPADVDQFNHRLRYKFGVDALYTLRSWVAGGVRVDRVLPSSKDPEQTFWVVAPRLVFRTNWMAREAITLTYAKWFYGANTHPEAGSIIASDGRLDDQLIALNVNLWW